MKSFTINRQDFIAQSPEEFIESEGADTLVALLLECEAQKHGMTFGTLEHAKTQISSTKPKVYVK